MNRRDFIDAAIGALVAALALPFENFAAWCRRWFSSTESVLYLGREVTSFVLGERLAVGFGGSPGESVTITKIDRLRGTITVSA